MLRLLPLLLVACSGSDSVDLQGVLTEGPDGSVWTDAATLTVRGADGEVLGSTETSDGLYRLEAPRGASVFLEVSGAGLTPASFSGVTGHAPRLRIPDGEVFAITEAQMVQWETTWAGCPGIGSGGAVVGEVRVIDLTNDDGEHPTINSAYAQLHAQDDSVLDDACYLLEDGSGWDPEATRTGPQGVFALFGVEPGRYVLEVGYDIGGGQSEATEQDIWVPEGGVVPRLPMWVEFALPG